MPSKVYPVAFYIVLFGGLLLLLTHWKQEQELLTAQLTAKRATEDAARRAKSDLELEIRRLRDFQDEADNELQEDGKKLQLLEVFWFSVKRSFRRAVLASGL